MELKSLFSLLTKGEGPRVEWKRQINIDGERAKEEFIKDLTAMANTFPGDGYILYGITDAGRIVGIPKKKGLEETLQQIVSTRSYPPVEFSCEWIEKSGKNLLVVCIPESKISPHATFRRDIYIRRQRIVDKATIVEIREMLLNTPRKTDGSRPTPNAEVQPGSEEPVWFEYQKYDLDFFPLSGIPQSYRKCQKYPGFDDPAICPVFMPHYGIFVPEPEFGDTKSVITFDWEADSLNPDRETFQFFLKTLERRTLTLGGESGVWNCFPMSWSFSGEHEMCYGLGADNACLALDAYPDRGLFAAIIQFERVNVYKPTNFVVVMAEIYSRQREIFVRQLALKAMLSTIPLSRDWLNSLFDVTEILDPKTVLRKPGDDAISEPLHTLRWIPEKSQSSLRPEILGLFGRDPGSKPEYDIGLGVVIKTKSLGKVTYELDQENSWHWEWYKDVFKVPPSSGFDELPIQITNHIPTRGDLASRDFGISLPTMRQAIIGLAGFVVFAINVHCFPRELD